MRVASCPRGVAPVRLAAGLLALVALLVAAPASAYDRVIVRDWRTPVGYDVELEPHLVLGTAPPAPGYGTGAGVGIRLSGVLLPEGFIDRLNDSVALGVGLDYGHYTASWAINGYRDECLHFAQGPNGTLICTDTTSNGGSYNYLFIPVVMQWSFWITQRFSGFLEPGIDLYYLGRHGFSIGPAVYLGGRVRVTDRVAVTLRLGYPTVSLGASFFL